MLLKAVGKENSFMKDNDKNLHKKILEVHNYNTAGTWFDILVPLQLTLEYCRGITAADFYSILMISPRETYFHTAPIDNSFQKFNTRAPHQHNYFELLIVLEGEVIQKIEDKEYVYHAGTCCLINRNIVHMEKFIGEAKLLFIGLSTELVHELLSSCKSAYFPEEGKALENSILKFMEENILSDEGKTYLDFFPAFQNQNSISDLHRISDQLINAMLMPKLGSTFLLKGYIFSLFQYLDDKSFFHITPVSLNSSTDLILFSRINHLFEDTYGRMTRSELEKALNYSGNYLNTVVNRYTGMCLFDYGTTFCLKKAEQLLATTDDSVSDIAARLHFSNRTHFYNLFREKYGMTPGEYRKKLRNE